jgi:hypothetical protein
MNAISSCINTIQGLPAFKSNDDLQQLHSVLQEATTNPQQLHKLIQQSKDQATQSLPRVEQSTQPLPRVAPSFDDNQRVTRSANKTITTVSIPVQIHSALPRTLRRKKRGRAPSDAPTRTPSSAPAMNTRAKTAAKASLAAPPAMNTRARRSQLRQPTPAPPNLRQRLQRVQNEVHRALLSWTKPLASC